MKIHQIYTDSILRNFTYIIQLSGQTAYVVDPWNSEQINKFLSEKHLKLIAIINTHEHWDHIQGNQNLVAKHQCEVWAHPNGKGTIPGLSRLLNSDEKIQINANCSIQILDTPGHSQAHLCFIVNIDNKPHCIFTGDILFNAGVGNCNNGGDVSDLYESVKNKISTLPDNIIIYPGHEYLENNLKFTLDREPSNKKAKQWLQKYQQIDIFTNPLTTTLADEKKINTFLRLDQQEIISNLSCSCATKRDVFISLRRLRDKW